MRVICSGSTSQREKSVSQSRYEVRRVLIITLLLNLAVALAKIILGLFTGALAIMADGFHSLTDSAGNIVGLIANFIAARPADDDHPYGHRRFETLAALVIAALLLLTAWELVKGVIERLQETIVPETTPLSFIVLIATLLINIGVSRYQIRAGTRLNSEILLADAKNTSADVFVTLSVLLSTAIMALTGWVWVDIVAALLVTLLIGKAAWEILQDTGRVLVDTAPYSPDELKQLIEDISPDIIRARSRGSIDAAQIDIDLSVAPEMTTEQSESIAYAIRRRIGEKLEGIAEVEVHFVPDHANGRNPILTARAYADARGLSTHEVQISYDTHGCVLEMHVEVPPQQSLIEAHEQVSLLEADLSDALPEIDRVITHIEPQQAVLVPDHTQRAVKRCKEIRTEVQNLLQKEYPAVGWHDFAVRAEDYGFALNLHATLPAQISVEAAHQLAESAESMLRVQQPLLSRVTIHTEPFDHE